MRLSTNNRLNPVNLRVYKDLLGKSFSRGRGEEFRKIHTTQYLLRNFKENGYFLMKSHTNYLSNGVDYNYKEIYWQTVLRRLEEFLEK